MNQRQTVLKNILFNIHSHLTPRRIIVAMIVLAAGGYVLMFAPRTVVFSYGGNNCVDQLSFAPGLLRIDDTSSYRLEVTDALSVAGHTIWATKVCVVPTAAPKEGSTKVSIAPLGWLFARQTYTIVTTSTPVVSVASLPESLPITKAVILPLSEADTVFDYDMLMGDERVACASSDSTLECDLAQLPLTQGKVYTLGVERSFDDYSEVIAQKEVRVTDPVKVTGASVRTGQTIYSTPAHFTIDTDKVLSSAEATLERTSGDDTKLLDVGVGVSSKRITVTPVNELQHGESYTLTLSKAVAEDGSTIAKRYVVKFKLSSGPKVSSVNIDHYGVDQRKLIVLNFDQTLQSGQNIAQFVHVSGRGAASVAQDGDSVYIQLNSMDRCTDFTITVDKGIASKYGVVGDEAWSYSSRTRCALISTIGYSVQQRPIYAYYFGSGATKVLFTAAIHGSEVSSKYLADGWIAYLEAHARDIPSDRQIVVVPSVNPDGVAAGTRYNANDINLNRNFATTNWVSDTETSRGVEEGAGGSAPLSEPESAALAALTERLQPRLVVTYHSQGSLINSNDVGIAATLGPRYASMVGYSFVASEATTGTFGFEMTGTYEDWLAERGTPAVLIELPTHTGWYFSAHSTAMWMMVKG